MAERVLHKLAYQSPNYFQILCGTFGFSFEIRQYPARLTSGAYLTCFSLVSSSEPRCFSDGQRAENTQTRERTDTPRWALPKRVVIVTRWTGDENKAGRLSNVEVSELNYPEVTLVPDPRTINNNNYFRGRPAACRWVGGLRTERHANPVDSGQGGGAIAGRN